jgi:hypothetical protein
MSEQLTVKQILNSNPEIDYDNVIQAYPYLKITRSGFYTAKYRNKHKQKKYAKQSPQVKSAFETKLLEFIKSLSDGVSAKQIEENFKISSSHVYTKIYELKKKYNIERINDKYVFKSEKPKEIIPVTLGHIKKQDSQTQTSFDNETYKAIKDLNKLPVSDRNDYLDMFKKKRFYELCLESLMKSNEVVENIKHTFLTM